MDRDKGSTIERLVGVEWIDALREAVRSEGLGYDPVFVRMWTHGDELIALVRRLGGTVTPLDSLFHWVLHTGFNPRKDAWAEWVPDLRKGQVGVNGFNGIVRIDLEGRSYLVLCAEAQASEYPCRPVTVVAGPDLERTLAFVARVKAARMCVERREPVVCGTTVRTHSWTPIEEDDLVLPRSFKDGLLTYLDGYWRTVGGTSDWRSIPTRGVLFVGKPGTGKTLTGRHIIGRYPDVRAFLYVNDGGSSTERNLFRDLIHMIEEYGEPSIVLIEDIDRIFRSGATTPEFLLNVLDGMLRPSVPVLWIATSNDPSELQDNLMDRPGRFDRVFVFPMPGLAEREALIRTHSRFPLSADVVREIASLSEGFTGAHLREVCVSASFRCAEDVEIYPNALREEAKRMKTLRRGAKQSRSTGLRQEEVVGFRAQ